MAARHDGTFAWIGAGLVVIAFPLVARATFDEYDGDGAPEDAPAIDAAPSDRTARPDVTITTTTFGGDAGGMSCGIDRHRRSSLGAAAIVSLSVLSLGLSRVRSKTRS